MDKEDIHLEDIGRILIGNAPPEFLLEVFIRTIISYIALQFVMRILGKRMNGKLTVIEMAVVLTMGAIVSVPMQSPDRGILQGLLVLTCAFLFQYGINWLVFKNKKVENFIIGQGSVLVKDGIMQKQQMKKARISTQQLFEKLRENEIYHLGKVSRVYIEASGPFSIYKEKTAKPGLSVIPEIDFTYKQEKTAQRVCQNCGALYKSKEANRCWNCNSNDFTMAVL